MKEITDEISGLIEVYKQRLSRLCCTLCGNYADADDLFQETWLKVIKNYDKYNKSKDFGKWLFSVCINTYKNLIRNSARYIQFSSTDEKEIFLSSLPDTAVQNEKYYELIETIKELPEKYKVVLALRYFNDYSEKDVAEILKIPAGTVKSRLSKAKELIRGRLSL